MFKKRKTAHLESTLKQLAAYHAVPLDNEQFVRQYRHLFAMYFNLCRDLKLKPIIERNTYV